MRSIAALGAAMGMALVLTPRTSAAEAPSGPTATPSESEAVSLAYESSPLLRCPSAVAFQAEVSKLTSKARFTDEPGARRVRIELVSAGREVVGRLSSGSGPRQATREVRGKNCGEVASALAIAVALTIDPEALGVSEASPDAAPRALGDAPPSASVQSPANPPERPRVGESAPAPRWRVGGAVGLVLENAWAPQMRPAGRVAMTLGWGERVRATVGGARFFTHEVDDVSFGAWMADASVSLNVAVLGVLRPFALFGYELGSVDAAGTGLSTSVSAMRPWHALTAGLGLRFETASFFLQLGGSLVAPISRQRYLVSDPFGGLRTLYEVPGLGLRQETNLGVFL